MKNLLNGLKKSFGFDDKKPPEAEVDQKKENPVIKKAPDPYSKPAAQASREMLIRFILQGLLPYIDEKTRPIAGLRVYYRLNDPVQDQIHRVALHFDEPAVFQHEWLEHTLHDHFIPLDQHWLFEYVEAKEKFPDNIFSDETFGLEVLHRGQVGTGPYQQAKLTILRGYAERKVYQLNPTEQTRFNIGRSKNPQLPSGKIQVNDIAFLDENDATKLAEKAGSNKHISRNHAYIRFNPQLNKYLLYADKGGLPENGNKLKIHTGDQVKWITLPLVGHELQEGDQIELGGDALIEFSLVHS